MDAASLKLMESLMGTVRHLMIIGAYRDNEVSPSHPLMATVERIEKSAGTSTGDGADHRSRGSQASGRAHRLPGLVIPRMRPGRCSKGILVPVDGDVCQFKSNASTASETAARLGVGDASLHSGAAGNGHHAIREDVIQNNTVKGSSRLRSQA